MVVQWLNKSISYSKNGGAKHAKAHLMLPEAYVTFEHTDVVSVSYPL